MPLPYRTTRVGLPSGPPLFFLTHRSSGTLLLAMLVVLASACASVPKTVFAMNTTDPRDAWAQLLSTRRGFDGLKSFARIRVNEGDRARSFNARIGLDRRGTLQIEGLTPLGTKAFTLHANGRDVTFINDLDKTFWSGDLEVLSRLMKVPVAGLQARELGMLLVGLPAGTDSIFDMSGNAEAGEVKIEHGPYRYSVAGAGFSDAVAVQGDQRIVFRYATPRYPAADVTVLSTTLVDGSGRLTEHLSVTHNEVVKAPEILSLPRMGKEYREGSPPAALPTEG